MISPRGVQTSLVKKSTPEGRERRRRGGLAESRWLWRIGTINATSAKRPARSGLPPKPALAAEAARLEGRGRAATSRAPADPASSCAGAGTRFLPAWQQIRALIDGGRVGEINAVQASLGFPILGGTRDDFLLDPSRGGGSLLEVGVYPAQLLQGYLGTPTGVAAAVVELRRESTSASRRR